MCRLCSVFTLALLVASGLALSSCRLVAGYASADREESRDASRGDAPDDLGGRRDRELHGERDAASDAHPDVYDAPDLLIQDQKPLTGHQLCVPSGFCWENPRPLGANLYGVWGAVPKDVWAVGERGTLLHWDGKHFRLAPRLPGIEVLWRVRGYSGAEVYAVGEGGIARFDGSAWHVDHSSPGETFGDVLVESSGVFAVGAGLYARAAGSWSKVGPIPGAAPTFAALCRGQGGALLVADAQGTIWEQDGVKSWEVHSTLSAAPFELWQPPGTDLHAATFGGLQRHVNEAWSAANSSPGPIYGVGGAKTHALAVGAGVSSPQMTSALIFDGLTWASDAPGVPGSLQSVWSTPLGAVAVGSEGRWLIRDAQGWREPLSSPTRKQLRAGYADGTNVLAGGEEGLLARAADGSWAKTSVTQHITAIGGLSGGALWLGTTGGEALRYAAGSVGAKQQLSSSGRVRRITSGGGRLFALADSLHIYRLEQGAWVPHYTSPVGVFDFVATNANELILATNDGITHLKGNTSPIATSINIGGNGCEAVSSGAPGTFAVCEGTLRAVDQQTLSIERSLGSAQELKAIFVHGNEVWAAGNNGLVLRRDPQAGWGVVDVQTATTFEAIFSDGGALFLVGTKGTILRRP